MPESTSRLRHVIGRLRAAPGHSTAMIATLAIGIASASALFAVVNGIALRELSLPDAERLVAVSTSRAGDVRAGGGMTPADLAELRTRVRSIDLAGFMYSEFVLAGEPAAERLIGATAEASVFATLRARPALGRVFQRGEDGPTAARVVVLAHSLWARRFGSDPGIVGRSITIDGAPSTVIGVMPEGFEFPRSARMAREVDLWTPLSFMISTSAPRGRASLSVIGRLAAGTTLAASRSELASVARELAAQFASTNRDLRFEIEPLRDQIVGPVRAGLQGMLAAVAVLLAILVISVLHLSVLRGISETRSTAIRVALGGSPARALAPLVGESLVLALVGGAIGLAASVPLRSALLTLAPDTLPRRMAIETDWRVIAFAAALSVLIGIAASVAPFLRLERVDLRVLLNESTRSATSRGSRRWRDVFVLSEIALTTVLLAGGIALMLAMLGLQRIDPGFRASGTLTASVSIAGPRYRSRDARAEFLASYLARIRSMPGVERAAAVNLLPMAGGIMSAPYRTTSSVDVAASDTSRRDEAAIRSVSDDYFETMGQRVVRGRSVGAGDASGAQPVAVVNEAFARRLRASGDVLGTLIHIASGMIDTTRAYEVVGVVADAKERDLRSIATPVIYLSDRQAPYPYNNFVIRTRGSTATLVAQLRAALREIDPDLALDEVSSLGARLRSGYAVDYFLLALVSAFAVLAVLLVCVGVYGVVARAVQSQMRALGVRLALGATPGGVRRMVGADALRLGSLGAGVGGVAAVALWPLARPALAARLPVDTGGLVLAVVLAVAFMSLSCIAAAAIPAIRAGRLSPIAILRDS